MTLVLRGLATANPPFYVTQDEAYEFMSTRFVLTAEQRALYRRILLEGRIKGRYFGMDAKEDSLETSPDRLLARYLRFARSTAVAAARKAMAEAGVGAAEISGLVVNTCTGYLCPGLSSYIAEDLGLSNAVRARDLMGMGCGAAIPNLETAGGLLARRAEGPVLSIAVEICSATIFPAHEPDLVVSNSIFGDGAAAAVVDLAERVPANGLPRLVDFESGLFPQYREDLRYRSEGGLLRNSLSKRVPVIGGRTITEVSSRLLARHGLAPSAITWWMVHAGGIVVLTQVARALGLDEARLRHSYEVFENYGNMSSPTVLFALRGVLDSGQVRPGERGLLLSFGAGFSAFAALVEF
jgi:alkylresorcinol/alkylpyrone synthase